MDYVKHRKTVEDQASPILVIGSRAFEGNFATSSKDWDLIIPHSSLVTFVDHHYDQFSWLNVQGGPFPKITGRLLTGQMLELELVENYASNQLLYTDKFIVKDWRQYTTNYFGVGQIKLQSAEKSALLALKYSTCFFPVHWNKNIRHMVAIKKDMKLRTFDQLFEKQDVRQLVDLRARETLARCLHYKRIFRRQLVSDNECKTAEYISRAFEQYNTGDQNCIDFPLTGIKIDRTKFMLATDVQKKIIVEEQLTLLERYFSAYGAQRAAELALEAFFTQSVPVIWRDQLNSLLTKTHCVYTKSVYHSPELQTKIYGYFGDHEYDTPFLDTELYQYIKQELPQCKAPIASDAELQQSTCNNIAIVWALDHIEEFFDRHVMLPTNFTHTIAAVSVPHDVWHLISGHIDDHITLAAFETVCKGAAHSADWKRLVLSCWRDEDLEAHQAAMSAPHPNWKMIFRAIYTEHVSRMMYACPHCGGNHYVLNTEEWDKFYAQRDIDAGTEAYGGNCICIHCTAGSWGSCAYANGPSGEIFNAAEVTQPSRCLVQ